MRSSPVRYGIRFGCRFGAVHNPITLHETAQYKVERCKLCGIRKRYNKALKGRTDNIDYLKFHVRSFAQPGGSTKRVYAKMHNPSILVIKV